MARPKGAKNKVSESAKDNILAVFTRLGGTHAMADWAKENLTEFYKIYARLLPQSMSVDATHRHTVDTGDAATLKDRLNVALSNRNQPTIQ